MAQPLSEQDMFELGYTPQLLDAFKKILIELLANDEDVYRVVLRRSVDILDSLGYEPRLRPQEKHHAV